ncbi:MAG: hypothetical protein JXN64_08635 [Spirochaetes bacterium]|nr:hypothetical protein [Spirochaetota bacterium]
MKLSAPKFVLWLIALIIGVLGLLGYLISIPFITVYAFWLVFIGFVLLLIGTAFKGI